MCVNVCVSHTLWLLFLQSPLVGPLHLLLAVASRAPTASAEAPRVFGLLEVVVLVVVLLALVVVLVVAVVAVLVEVAGHRQRGLLLLGVAMQAAAAAPCRVPTVLLGTSHRYIHQYKIRP